ncbi:MAG: putative addiction module antidote protein [Syntrophales bacterium]|jgi:probable addiction module antidote protein|nr:putative addiction module antidote protein [Syntrophales bacterium]MDD2387978.1 putative addiction module antidote protein [Bacteroidales bacterium]MDD4339748.1 putative addiction module antidote protein [Syntrophales bacterium]HPB70576.1 putative addiction module antidote protein [Syntrophales bacterium]HQN26042.1 putative addiction module antidote protein [Syntrophales bacterium]
MKRTSAYKEELLTALRDPEEAAAYLNAALEDANQEVFLLALKDVIAARGGISRFADKVDLNRVSLYRTLSKRGNPELRTLNRMLGELGFSLSIKTHAPVGSNA